MLFLLSPLLVLSARADDVALSGTKAPGAKFATPETHLSAEFGGAWTTGNSASWALNGSLNGTQRIQRSEFGLKLNANIGQSIVDKDGNGFLDNTERGVGLSTAEATAAAVGYQPTAEKYEGTLRYDYYVGDNDSLYGQLGLLRDKFAGFALRTQGELGYRRLLADTDKLKLTGELGAGVANEDYIDPTKETATFLGADAKINFTYTFNESVSLEESADLYDPFYNFTAAESAVDAFRFKNTAAVVAKLSDKFSLKVSHQLQYANVPNTVTLSDGSEASFKKLDQTTMATFVASLL